MINSDSNTEKASGVSSARKSPQAQQKIQELTQEQPSQIDRQPKKRTILFEEHRNDQDSPSWNWKEESRVRKRLTSAGIKWEMESESRDCERLAPDPEYPGSFTIELGSVTTVRITVANEDAARAKEVLAMPDGPPEP